MHDRYSKLFSSIVTSSVWVADDQTLRVWVAFLAMMDSDGYVAGAVPGLASLCRMSVAEFERVLDYLSSPDPYSRTADHEGRRIEKVDGGWRVLNAVKYDQAVDLEKRREQARERQARLRANRNGNADVTQCNADVTQCNAPQPHPHPQPNKEKESPAEIPKRKVFVVPELDEVGDYAVSRNSTQAEAARFYDYHTARGWKMGKETMKDWKAAFRYWQSNAKQDSSGRWAI